MIGPIREADRGEWEIRTQFNKLSEQHVEGDVNSGVAYVRVVIHGNPADVHGDFSCVGVVVRDEALFFSGARVVKEKRMASRERRFVGFGFRRGCFRGTLGHRGEPSSRLGGS